MAAKRLRDESVSEADCPEEKGVRTTLSFTTVIREVMVAKSMENLFSDLEPLLRKVIKEEVERGVKCVKRSMSRSPSMLIQALEDSSLQLVFRKKLCLPVFTGNKIEDEESSPLQILLVDNQGRQADLPYPIKIEVVVLDGEFPKEEDDWTPEEFDKNIVKEREGRRPLLTGEVLVTMRDSAITIGDIEFTDNSSWIRSRKFRLGARVAQGSSQGITIKEAKTESFSVKDHRGESYKKHYPPALGDDVWRLQRIGKEGAFHKKLAAAGIKTVQDFLKLSVVSPVSLRTILGGGMSDKMWEGTLKHANTCIIGDRRYLHKGTNFSVVLNAICQVVGLVVNGQNYPANILNGLNRSYVEHLVEDAYKNWSCLEEISRNPNENALLTYEPVTHESHHSILLQSDLQGGPVQEAPLAHNSVHGGFYDWTQNLSSLPLMVEENRVYNNSPDLSSDDDSNCQTLFNHI